MAETTTFGIVADSVLEGLDKLLKGRVPSIVLEPSTYRRFIKETRGLMLGQSVRGYHYWGMLVTDAPNGLFIGSTQDALAIGLELVNG